MHDADARHAAGRPVARQGAVSPRPSRWSPSRVEALGLPIEPLKRFKPWLLALTLLGLEWQKAGFDAELGLDKHFYDRAERAGKPVQGLETVDFQISRFDEHADGRAGSDAGRTLRRARDARRRAVTTLADAWKAGDAPTVERIVLEDLKRAARCTSGCSSSATATGCRRSKRCSPARGRAFVVVGAAHLVGPDGLLAMLRAKGYQVEQM